jgi:hypothetical protein
VPEPHDIDGVLIQWGDRLFYPGNRIVKAKPPPKLSAWRRDSVRRPSAPGSRPPSCAECRR